MDSNKETLKTSSVKLRKSDPDIQLIPTNSRLSTPVDLASRHNSTPDNFTPDNLTPNNLTPADNLNLSQNIRPQTVQLGQFDNLSFNPEQIQTSSFIPGSFIPGSFNIGNFNPGPFNPGNYNSGIWNHGNFNPNNSSIDLSTLECSIQDGTTTTVRLGNFNRNPEQINETSEYNFGRFNPGFNLGQINYGQFNTRPYDHRFSAGLLNPGLFNPTRFNPTYRSFNSLPYEGLVHENQGKRTEGKNENLVRKNKEVQSAIQEENNTPEKTSKFYFLNLSKN